LWLPRAWCGLVDSLDSMVHSIGGADGEDAVSDVREERWNGV